MNKRKIFLVAACLMLLMLLAGMRAELVNVGGEESVSRKWGSWIAAAFDGESAELPEINIESWEYRLVNSENPFFEADGVATCSTRDGYLFDVRAKDALDAMLAACEAAGLSPVLTSAWRSTEYQRGLYEDKVSRMEMEGYGPAEAEKIAAREVARPGYSEHHLGLAADIVSLNYNIMEADYAESPEAAWLMEHCAEYGFILRYPEDKQDITKIIYEPWHFRYVGEQAAGYIMKNGLCLEEFLTLYGA